MNITGLLLPLALAPAIMKFIKRTSNGSQTFQDPRTDRPSDIRPRRPTCKIGQKAIWDQNINEYRCVVDFD